MKIRNCPVCGYQFPFRFYVRNMLFKSVHTKWTCPECRAKLTVNQNRRFIIAVFAIIPVFSGIYLLEMMKNAAIPRLMSWVLLLLIYFVWLIIALSFDTFKADKK